VAQKKCPKCGEDNPAEAVMCWACYTPLTGAAAASASAGVAARPAATPVRPMQSEDSGKKPVSPGLIGMLAIVALIALVMGLKSVMGGSPDDGWVPPIVQPGGDTGAPLPPESGPAGEVAPAPEASGGGVPLPGTIPPVALPYKITTLPNSNRPYGTMALVPTEANVSESRAASLAAFQLRRYSKGQVSRWNEFHIFVFKDMQSAQVFNDYVKAFRTKPLTSNDYNNLKNIWPNTLVRYQYYNQREYVDYPSKNPSGWWLKRR